MIKKSNYKGFTLIELITILLIIGLLISLLIPSFYFMRKNGLVVACSSNLRQVGINLNAYGIDYNNYPTNELDNSYSETNRCDFYYYYTRKTMSELWISQLEVPGHKMIDTKWIDDRPGITNKIYRCTEELPSGGELSGSVGYTQIGNTWSKNFFSKSDTWSWAGRISTDSNSNDFSPSILMRDRSWYAYLPVLHIENGFIDGVSACSNTDIISNAWIMTDGYSIGNNALSTKDPINRDIPVNSSTIYGGKRQVISYCPSMVLIPTPTLWFRNYRSPHMGQSLCGDKVGTESEIDSRNYLFTDGSVLFINRGN